MILKLTNEQQTTFGEIDPGFSGARDKQNRNYILGKTRNTVS